MKKVIFLDRDGVINQFPGIGQYVTTQRQFRFIPKSLKAIALLTKHGYRLFVVTNQGCVSRGMISLENLNKMTFRMQKMIEKNGGSIERVFNCVHQSSDHCRCKKPRTLFFKKGLRQAGALAKNSFVVGDSDVDIQAGKRIGATTVLVLSGRNKKKDLADFKPKPNHVAKDLWEAACQIVQKKY